MRILSRIIPGQFFSQERTERPESPLVHAGQVREPVARGVSAYYQRSHQGKMISLFNESDFPAGAHVLRQYEQRRAFVSAKAAALICG